MARLKSGYTSWIAAIGIAAAYWLLAVTVMPRVGATFDEPGHITSGYVYWKFGDFRINAENGMLATRAAALPLLGLDLRFPAQDTPAWRLPNTRALAGSFFFELGNDFPVLIARPRLVSALFGVGLLLLVWGWARRLFGSAAGWLALGLGALSPTLLAHGGLATSDIVVSFCLLAALSAFWRLWHVVTWWRLVVASVAAAATLLAKTSGLLLLPMLAALLVARLVRPSFLWMKLAAHARLVRSRGAIAGMLLATLGTTAVASVALIWAAYQFRFDAAPSGHDAGLGFDPPWETVLAGTPHEPAAGSSAAGLIESGFTRPPPTLLAHGIRWLRDRRLLPEAYLWSIAFTFQASRTRPSFLWGEASTTGSRWFFPAAFVLKTTPAELVLFALGICGAFFIRKRAVERSGRGNEAGASVRRQFGSGYFDRYGAAWLHRAAPLLALFIVYGLVAINTPLNIGHRHLLPIYAVVFIVAGGAARLLRWHRTIALAVLGLAMIAQALDSWSVRPFYLSYFTPAARARAWDYLVDSSYDWGQGLPDLARWLATKSARGDQAPVFLSYFGSDSPRARGVAVTRLADWRDDTGPRDYPAPVRGGWYVISATNFQRVYLGVSGPWSAAYEQRYQELRASFPKDAAAASRLTPAERDAWLRNAMIFEILQFGRLCHFLRGERPVEVIGSSLLVFRLSDEEIRAVANAPLPDLEAVRSRRTRAQ